MPAALGREDDSGFPKPMRFYEIDVLRFAAALAVVLFHYTFRGAAGEAFTGVTYPELAGITKYGCLGVDLFFMISGFVILMTAAKKSAPQFVVSRIVRLYPALWCCCTLTFLATVLVGDPHFTATGPQYLANLTMLNGFVGIESIDGAYWSLFVEMKFYFLVFMLVLLGQIRFIDSYLGLWLAAAIGLSFHPVKGLTGLLLPEYAAHFIAGAVFFRIAQQGSSLYRTLLLAASFGLSAVHQQRGAAEFERLYGTPFSLAAVLLLMAAFYVLFYLIATRKTGRLPWKKLAWCGSLTYPLYLLHQNIGYMLFNALGQRVERYVLLCGTVGLMLAAAYGVHRRIEEVYSKPLQRFLERTLDLAKAVIAERLPRRLSA